MRSIFFLAMFTLVLPGGVFASVTSQPDTFHVYAAPESTYSTIQSGINAASNGDLVIVHPGTYEENIRLKSGIDVISSDGPDSTFIAGHSSWTRTAYVSYQSDILFSGFTINGEEGYGMYAEGSTLDVNDLVFDCDPDSAILFDFHSEMGTVFDSITIEGPTEVKRALHASGSHAEYSNLVVRNLQNLGVYISNGHGPEFEDFTIDSCGTGIYIYDAASANFVDGSVSACTTGVEAYTSQFYASTTRLQAMDVDIFNCITGFSTGADSDYVVIVAIDSCTITDCTDGMILDRSKGSITHTEFDGIDDIGITITESDTLLIGAPADSNVFNDIDGVGILADSAAVVIIDANEFTDILGTAIQVETENDSTYISYCEMDGTGACFEGIITLGSGTMAKIRSCEITDYGAHQTPEPRGITVLGATAHLGHGNLDQGNNSLMSNAIDLCYLNKAATPDTLRAEYNWWGETPPDTNEFAGLKTYIDYDPWLTSAPRMLPISEDLEELPMAMKLTSVSPNPSSGSAELHFWMPGDGNLELRVYGLDGRLVRVLYNGQTAAGTGSVIWDGDDRLSKPCPSGVYLIRMKSRFGTDTARFVLVK